jgi:hypothetical protein
MKIMFTLVSAIVALSMAQHSILPFPKSSQRVRLLRSRVFSLTLSEKETAVQTIRVSTVQNPINLIIEAGQRIAVGAPTGKK